MASVFVGTTKRCVPVHVSRLPKKLVLVNKIHVPLPRRAGENDDSLGTSQTKDSKSPHSPSKFANARERKFSHLLDFVRDRTGREKVVKSGQVRATAWQRLFQLANKPEHLEVVAKTFPRWRESGKVFTQLDTEMFIRRCAELDCPLLALNVLGDHPKYGLTLSSFPAARTLLHALYQKYPVENMISAVSLMGVNKLSPVTSDLASCTMLYAACLRSRNKHASLLGRDLRVALQDLLRNTTPYSEPEEKKLRARYSVKPDLWVMEALRDIKKTKKDQGRGSWWITEWVARGEGRVLPSLAERRCQANPGGRVQESLPPLMNNVARQLHA